VTRTRVAVTGVGAVTPLANDAPGTWAALVAGRSGIGPLTTFDASTYPVHIGGMVKDFDLSAAVPEQRLRRYLSRAGGFGVAAMVEALADADVAPGTYRPEERAISMAGSVTRPPLDELVEFMHVRAGSDGHRLYRGAPSAVVQRAQNVPVAVMAIIGDVQGPTSSINTACAASAHSIGEAYRWIQEGDARLVIAGGYDALTGYLDVMGFALLGALTEEFADEPTRASRPFDRDRAGFVIGEGAVMFVLEEMESALARGANIRAEIVGYGSSMNGYRITDSPPDGNGAVQAMSAALAESGLDASGIDYVAAHGTGTAGNDSSETVAIKKVFGEAASRLAISSPKSMAGHLTAAAGALNVLAAVGAIEDQVAPPTINLEHPDPKLDLDYVPNRAKPMKIRAALVNAFAFGGTNACLVLRENHQ
jgi:3-oxoacyl-[acyl-carrier-protein] synthase II